MNDDSLQSTAEIKSFLTGTSKVFIRVDKTERNAWIAGTLKRTRYFKLSKKDKGIIQEYLLKGSGLSRQQLTRLIGSYKKHRWIERKKYGRNKFANYYTREDILLLAETDKYHQTLSGPATKKLFDRAYNVFHDKRYGRLVNISVAHIYNLRKSRCYFLRRRNFEETKRSAVSIGERRKPRPHGEPGYIRIDTVHQGDEDKRKGVYHINAVDEVTQYEVVCSVEAISERHLIPVLAHMLDIFPFEIKGFHSDNGSEYVNHKVEKLLNKLHVEFTKSRSRHSNDNALAECKNGAIVRKLLGYTHIPQKYAEQINDFNIKYWLPYLNFHRPCFFVEKKIDKKGKIIKTYPYEKIMTPYEKLKSLPHVEKFLKPGVSFTELDKEAMKMTDLEAAKKTHEEKNKLFSKIFKIRNK